LLQRAPSDDAAGCESCNRTPTNRFSMMAAGPSSSPGQRKSFAEVVAAAQQSTGSSFEAKLKFMEEIGRMDAAALAGLIRSASGALDVPRMNSFEFRFAVSRLVELEPRKAAALWAENGLLRVYGSLSLESWIKKDPQDFASWARESTHDLGGAARSAIRAFAADNPEKFAELAAQLSTSPVAGVGARAAIDRMLAREPASPEKALAYARALPEGEARNTALFAMLKWPGTNLWSDPEVAGALAQAAPKQAWRLGIETAAVGSPEKLPAGPARQSAFQFSVESDAIKDPDAAAKRLESLAGTADYAPAVRGFVDALAGRDPAAAAEWALSIDTRDKVQRNHSLNYAASRWFEADPEAARAWVEKAPLTDAEFLFLTGRERGR